MNTCSHSSSERQMLEVDLPGPYSSPLLYPLPDSSSQCENDDDGPGPGVGELHGLEDEDALTLWTILLVLVPGIAELIEIAVFLSFLSLCLGLRVL